MVEGRADQAHRPGHVRENLIPKKPGRTGGAAPGPAHSHRLVFNCVHPCIPVARTRTRWPVGNDSPFNGQSATLSNHFHSGRKRRKDK